MRVYRTGQARHDDVMMEAAIAAATTEGVVWTTRSPVAFTEAGEAEYRIALPLDDLGVGSYRLTISAFGAEDRSAEQHIAFQLSDGT